MTSRRDFILSAATASALGGCLSSAADGDAYSVALLGDLHYDASPAERFHSAFLRRWTREQMPNRYREFARNAAMWRVGGLSRRLLAASAACVTDDTAFVVQLGDVVQGDCESDATHRRMLEEASGLLQAAYPSRLPVVLVAGNHDIRSGGDNTGAAAAFGAFAAEWNGRELAGRLCGGGVPATDFAFRHGPDVFFAFDFNDVIESKYAKGPSSRHHLARQLELLKAYRAERHTFVLVHGPVLPPGSGTDRRWFYLGSPSLDDARRAVRAELAAREAIVFAGHTHRLEFKDASFPEGRLTEVTLNSVTVADDREVGFGPKSLADAPADYSSDGGPLFDEYRPHLRRYALAEGAGHGRLRVSAAGVWFDYFDRDTRTPTRTIQVR